MSESKKLFAMWKNEHEAQASRSPTAKRELEQVIPYVKELEERITSLEWSVDHVTELYHMEVAGEDW